MWIEKYDEYAFNVFFNEGEKEIYEHTHGIHKREPEPTNLSTSVFIHNAKVTFADVFITMAL